MPPDKKDSSEVSSEVSPNILQTLQEKYPFEKPNPLPL
jgi:hypothetical protein